MLNLITSSNFVIAQHTQEKRKFSVTINHLKQGFFGVRFAHLAAGAGAPLTRYWTQPVAFSHYWRVPHLVAFSTIYPFATLKIVLISPLLYGFISQTNPFHLLCDKKKHLLPYSRIFKLFSNYRISNLLEFSFFLLSSILLSFSLTYSTGQNCIAFGTNPHNFGGSEAWKFRFLGECKLSSVIESCLNPSILCLRFLENLLVNLEICVLLVSTNDHRWTFTGEILCKCKINSL